MSDEMSFAELQEVVSVCLDEIEELKKQNQVLSEVIRQLISTSENQSKKLDEEVTKLRDEADIIITNPPFSKFREFLAWILEAEKRFVIIGSKNAITYKDIFPLLKDNITWLGPGFSGGNAFIND